MVVVAEAPEFSWAGSAWLDEDRFVRPHSDVLRAARSRFVENRHMAETVRPEIATSWRRSLLAGVSSAASEPEGRRGVNLECQLVRVARPVLEEREFALARSGCGVVLTNSDACVLARWGSDRGLEAELDRHHVVPGNCFAESVVGTNSAALAIETGQPAEVYGAEHFVEAYSDFSSAGAPVFHPLNRRLLGTLNVVCRSADASPMQMPWLLEVVREVERRLRNLGSAQEQLLFESYMAAKRDSRRPVVCLNDQTILTNSPAARILGAVDKALLWEQASRAINGRADDVATLVLSDGRQILAHCRPIYDGGMPVGAKIEIEFDEPRSVPNSGRRDAAATATTLEGLAGHSLVWHRFCDEACAARSCDSRVLLVGEAGAGKLAVASALFGSESIDIFDAALHRIEASEWLRRLWARLIDRQGVVVLRHLEALDDQTRTIVASLVASADREGPRIVGTLCGDAIQWDQFDRVLKVPALRDRLDDVRDIVQAFASRHSAQGADWVWMPDAIQTLSRLEWPANLRSLEAVVRQVVFGRRGGYIDARSLPDSVRAAASRRPLSRLEQVEAVAITDALNHSGGNKLEAAERLGIARSTLYRRMRALGIDLSETNY